MSHGHEKHVAHLLRGLAAHAAPLVGHVVVTHNLASQGIVAPEGGWPFRVTEAFNESPAGYARNHNRAFALCESPFFCVLNPDVTVADDQLLPRVLAAAREPGVGCAYPVLLNPDGTRQNEREVMSPTSLLRRHVLRRPGRRVDWVNGAFLLVPRQAWAAIGGFDERFHMYCEDTDFCLRLQLAGWRLARADASAVHEAAWASRRPGRAFVWHVRSMLRLWRSAAYREYLALRRQGAAADATQ